MDGHCRGTSHQYGLPVEQSKSFTPRGFKLTHASALPALFGSPGAHAVETNCVDTPLRDHVQSAHDPDVGHPLDTARLRPTHGYALHASFDARFASSSVLRTEASVPPGTSPRQLVSAAECVSAWDWSW